MTKEICKCGQIKEHHAEWNLCNPNANVNDKDYGKKFIPSNYIGKNTDIPQNNSPRPEKDKEPEASSANATSGSDNQNNSPHETTKTSENLRTEVKSVSGNHEDKEPEDMIQMEDSVSNTSGLDNQTLAEKRK